MKIKFCFRKIIIINVSLSSVINSGCSCGRSGSCSGGCICGYSGGFSDVCSGGG